jgi:DNA repair photolyase
MLIETPRGRAAEYADFNLELYQSDASTKGGCVHGCTYCYVPGCLKITPKEFRTNVRPREDIIGRLRKEVDFWNVDNSRVLMSFFSDPYQPVTVPSVTRKALRVLWEAQVPFAILTKGGQRACADFDLYRPGRDAFGTTLTTLRTQEANGIEPGAASPRSRIAAMAEAKARGIHTFLSLEPVLSPEESLDIIDATAPYVDHFRVGKWNHDARADKINWKDFGKKAVARLQAYNCKFTIKHDLERYLHGITYTNTEDRRVFADL